MAAMLLRKLKLFCPLVRVCIVQYANRARRVIYGWQSATAHNVDS